MTSVFSVHAHSNTQRHVVHTQMPKAVKVALATLLILASYVIFPPLPATILSALIFTATIISLSDTDTEVIVEEPTRTYHSWIPSYLYWNTPPTPVHVHHYETVYRDRDSSSWSFNGFFGSSNRVPTGTGQTTRGYSSSYCSPSPREPMGSTTSTRAPARPPVGTGGTTPLFDRGPRPQTAPVEQRTQVRIAAGSRR